METCTISLAFRQFNYNLGITRKVDAVFVLPTAKAVSIRLEEVSILFLIVCTCTVLAINIRVECFKIEPIRGNSHTCGRERYAIDCNRLALITVCPEAGHIDVRRVDGNGLGRLCFIFASGSNLFRHVVQVNRNRISCKFIRCECFFIIVFICIIDAETCAVITILICLQHNGKLVIAGKVDAIIINPTAEAVSVCVKGLSFSIVSTIFTHNARIDCRQIEIILCACRGSCSEQQCD